MSSDVSDTAVTGRRWIYVAGAGRSGSTLLGALLERATGGFDCGELLQLWWAIEEDRLCECGEPVRRCPVWGEVAQRVTAEVGLPSVAMAADRIRGLRRSRTDVRLPRPTVEDLRLRSATERAVEAVTGASTLVDTSKSPFVLATVTPRPRPLTVVHLVRDPRAVVYSRSRDKPDPARGGSLLRRKPTWLCCAQWMRANYVTHRVVSRPPGGQATYDVVRLRYEELARDPVRAVESIVGPLPPGASLTEPSGVRHAVAGNPARFNLGPVTPDERWRASLGRRSRVATVAVTAPFLVLYGYGWRGRRASGSALAAGSQEVR